MSHIQFNKDTRVELAVLLRSGKTHKQCGALLGMPRETVCNEINRNKDGDGIYRGAPAHAKYLARRKSAKQPFRKIENDRQLRRHIVRKLKQYWSPEQIAGRLKRVVGHSIVVHETIYTFIYEQRPDLACFLRHQKSKYRRKRGSLARIAHNKASKIRTIDERPLVVQERSRLGDWEGDTVIGKEKTVRVLTYVERRSGFAMAAKVPSVSAEAIQKKTVSLFSAVAKEKRLTLTRDNGTEFGDYDETLERKTKMKVYRADAYCSWQRGTNENWNGLFRQFAPKGTLFATLSEGQIRQAVRLLNDRPRKRLGYRTPKEVFTCDDSG